MKKPIKIVKIGGNVIDDDKTLAGFLDDFAALEGLKILIHGGGKIATKLAAQLGVSTQMIGGRRVTTREMMDVVLMVYGGLVNKKIVAQLQARSCNAVGLTGADLNCMLATKRPPEPIDYGYAGDIQQINVAAFEGLLQQKSTPVLAPLTHDMQGQLLNTNADTIAATTAVALAELYQVSLFYCFEKAGVLTNLEDETSLIERLDFPAYQQLKEEGIIADGMIPKLDNAFHTLRQGVTSVCILHHSQIKNIEKQHCKATNLCL